MLALLLLAAAGPAPAEPIGRLSLEPGGEHVIDTRHAGRRSSWDGDSRGVVATMVGHDDIGREVMLSVDAGAGVVAAASVFRDGVLVALGLEGETGRMEIEGGTLVISGEVAGQAEDGAPLTVRFEARLPRVTRGD